MEYSVLTVWLQLRDLVREAGLAGMSYQSRSLLLSRSILNGYMEMESSSETESEADLKRVRSDTGDSDSESSH